MNENKALCDWTLGEAKAYCTAQGDTCNDCPFDTGKGYCALIGEVPQEWEIPDESARETDKPRLCDVLGVEVGERFQVGICKVQIDADGMVYPHTQDALLEIVRAINYPARVERTPRAILTEREKAICHAMGATHVSLDVGDTDHVCLWDGEPNESNGCFGNADDDGPAWLAAKVDKKLFPSVKPGMCVEVDSDE